MDTTKEAFNYTYSAAQQEEVKRIREKYAPSAVTPEEDKMMRLRKLDESVTRPGTIASVTTGIVSTLILGTGMSLMMVWGGKLFIHGIFTGLLGMAGMAAAWPLHKRVTKRQREKLAPEIVRLTDELMK